MMKSVAQKCVSAALCLVAGAPLAQAETIDELSRAMGELQRKITELERAQAAAAKARAEDAAKSVTAGRTKGSLKLPGSDTSMTFGGYVKLDAVYSDPSAGVDSAGDLQLSPSTIAVGPNAGDHERNQVKFGARETRLFVKTNTPTSLSDLDAHVEVDFYGADGNESVSNSHGLRLRHAYFSLGRFLAGQTWTNFMNPAALPETLDFGGPAGQIFDRQAQVRWTDTFALPEVAARAQWSVALENPETVAQVPGGTSFRADDDHVPDLTAQLAFDTAPGRFSVHGLLRQVSVDSAASPAANDRRIGGAVSVAGIVPTIGKDDVRFTASVGNAIGRYANGLFPDAIVAAGGGIELPMQWTVFAGYRHFWSDAWRSSLVLSMAHADNPSSAPASTNRSARSAHVNLIWSPVERTDVGLEYIYADRETEDGQKGHLNRLQASAKYAF